MSRFPRYLRAVLTLSLLSAGTLLVAAQSLEAQPARAASRGAKPVHNASSATRFMVLETTPSGTRLVTAGGATAIGQPDDRFVALHKLSQTDVVVAGTRVTEEGYRVVLVESRLGPDGQRQQSELARPQALSRLPQTSPRLLAPSNDQAKLTAAWFEGNDPTRNEVWTADLTEQGFTRPLRVATAGPGSQVALQGVTLSNGEQLLLWSAFDGEDSEIVWVHRQPEVRDNGGWSRAQRLYPDNTVPDITPAIVAVGTQAIAAWSWFDGTTYRLMLSRFDGAGWSTPEPITQGAGIFPRFQPGASQPLLSYRAVAPRRWVYRQLDLGGSVIGEVMVVSEQAERPAILAASTDALVLSVRTIPPEAQNLAAVSETVGTGVLDTAPSSPQTFPWQVP